MMEIERENQFKADEEDVNDLFYRVFEYRNSAKFRKLLNFCAHFEKLLRPCNFKDGWLWEYTPRSASRVSSSQPAGKGETK